MLYRPPVSSIFSTPLEKASWFAGAFICWFPMENHITVMTSLWISDLIANLQSGHAPHRVTKSFKEFGASHKTLFVSCNGQGLQNPGHQLMQQNAPSPTWKHMKSGEFDHFHICQASSWNVRPCLVQTHPQVTFTFLGFLRILHLPPLSSLFRTLDIHLIWPQQWKTR